jgi:thiamine-monophosphate kinase
VALGLALRGVATAAIDLSDGLVGDLGHVLARSGVGATVAVDRIPRSPILAAQAPSLQHTCVLAGGDDYELLFTAPAAQDEAVRAAGARAGVAVAPIGHIEAEPGLRLVDDAGRPVAFAERGFDHFA